MLSRHTAGGGENGENLPWTTLTSKAQFVDCNPDYAAMELFHARLVRTTTCAGGCKCDYTICGDRDEYLKEHPEYVDEAGFRRNT